MFNTLYRWKLKNLNDEIHNVEAIDLLDISNQIIIQVSATCTKQKIDSTLTKLQSKSPEYDGYRFKFISIAKGAAKLRKKSYSPPSGVFFDPAIDIYDKDSILHDIYNLEIKHLETVFELIKSELGKKTDEEKLESNIASIINILSKEDLSAIDSGSSALSFDIEKKIDFNHLDTARNVINDHKIYHHIINKIYTEFDKLGSNKSLSVLHNIQQEYIKCSSEFSGDKLFQHVITNISQKVLNSSNFEKIPEEEMELCVGILVVDAFIRCKIFKNPKDYDYATA